MAIDGASLVAVAHVLLSAFQLLGELSVSMKSSMDVLGYPRRNDNTSGKLKRTVIVWHAYGTAIAGRYPESGPTARSENL